MYKEKYLKYKTKYTALKNQLGGAPFFFLEQDKTVPYYEKIKYVKKKFFNFFPETFYIIYYSHNEIKLVRILFKKNDKTNVYYEVEVPSLHLSYDNDNKQFIITLFIPTILDSMNYSILDPMKYWVRKLISIDDIKNLYKNIIKQLQSYDQIYRCEEIVKCLELIKSIMLNRLDKETDYVIKLITLLDSFMKEFNLLLQTIDFKSLPAINKEKEEAIQNYNLIVDTDIMQVQDYPPIQEERIQFEDEDKLKETYKEILSPEDYDQIIKYRQEMIQQQQQLESRRKLKAERDKEGAYGPYHNDYRDDDEF